MEYNSQKWHAILGNGGLNRADPQTQPQLDGTKHQNENDDFCYSKFHQSVIGLQTQVPNPSYMGQGFNNDDDNNLSLKIPPFPPISG